MLDKFGAGTIMTTFSVMGGIGVMVFARSDAIKGLIRGRILLGINIYCNLRGSLKLFTKWFRPSEFATLSAFIIAVGTLGKMMATSPLVLLIDSIRMAGKFFYYWNDYHFAFGVLFTIVRDNPEGLKSNLHKNKIKKVQAPLFYSIKTVFSNPNYWAISGGVL